MPKRSGKKKSKKGKSLATQQDGDSTDSAQVTTASPETLFASLSNATPQELESYMEQLFKIVDCVNSEDTGLEGQSTSQVGGTLYYDDDYYQPMHEQEFDYTMDHGEEDFTPIVPLPRRGRPPLRENVRRVRDLSRSPIQTRRHAPPLPPRTMSVPPPRIPPRDPTNVQPLYNYEAYRNASFANITPPRPPPRVRSRSPIAVQRDNNVNNAIANVDQIDNRLADDQARDRERRALQTATTGETTAEDPMAFNPDTLSTVIKDLLGIGASTPSGDFLNSYMLLGANLDDKIKSKIIAGEFVEMSALWDVDELPPRVNMSFREEDGSQLSFSPAKARDPNSFAEWEYLFFTFASVYSSYHPKEAGGVFSYMRRVADIHRDYPNTFIWRVYDTKFRKAKAKCKALPWHIMIPQMQSDARSAYYRSLATKKDRKPAPQPQPRGNQNQGPKRRVRNSCDRWNSVASCSKSNCKFLHVCSNCRGNHIVLNCTASYSAPPTPPPSTSAPPAAAPVSRKT